ncbi:hypothetical protein E1B28_002814 [Marasmius oreades]|uniref:Fungal-type protein kinase domain-containing protein n=1 Tax=Marasmius oreades TaxID=181124 RepID=A0A9P7RNF9_9AGAR|nr:uncharacterized protein E1B28_002814 [Marasmius oreades]KAG7086894.1 hypothetical protein E1B28_002814 [Marasmius oreades]
MAYDLFNSAWTGGHLYRHDLESIFYVLLYLCVQYTRPGKQVSASAKHKFPQPKFKPEPTDFFQHFASWLTEIQGQLCDGYCDYVRFRRSQQIKLDEGLTFDDQTLGGHFTYAIVNGIMSTFTGVELKERTESLD